MTTAQTLIMTGLLVALCLALVWMTIRARPVKRQEPGGNPGDKEKILQMLTAIQDQSTLSAYKKAYNIEDYEIASGS